MTRRSLSLKSKHRHAGPLYKMVQHHVLSHINSGGWQPGERVPSETELVEELDVSRMTVNRALRELAAGGFLVRIAGVGTFVAEKRPQGHLLEIRNIADEINERGHHHSATVIRLEAVAAPRRVAELMELSTNATVFHSFILHKENDYAVQLEDRYVNRAVAPKYLDQDFSNITPTQYLLEVAPLQEIELIVLAVMPSTETRRLLEMKANEPCLLLERRSWAFGKVAACTNLYHPSSRYELGDRFSPRRS